MPDRRLLLPRLFLLIPDGDLMERHDPPEIERLHRTSALSDFIIETYVERLVAGHHCKIERVSTGYHGICDFISDIRQGCSPVVPVGFFGPDPGHLRWRHDPPP